MVTTIATERLTIRPMSVDDAAFILTLVNDPSFIENIADRGVRTISDAEAYVCDKLLPPFAEHGTGMYLVSRRADGTPIGMCGFVFRDVLDGPDIGFAFLPAFHRRGYAREAASALLAHGFTALGFTTVFAVVNPDNRASIRLLEHLGLRRDGTVQLEPDQPAILRFRVDPA